MDVARPAGADSAKDGRGVAVADFNGDGRLDIVINNNNETPTLYLNNLRRSGNAVELRLVGAGGGEDDVHVRSTRDALGAVVRLTAGGVTMTRQVEAGSGYASESMRPLHFGLGGADHVDSIEIAWPGGRVQRIEGEALAAAGVNCSMTIEEGGYPSGLVALTRPASRPAAAVLAGTPHGGNSGATH
jgi:enediyne biosynthesis protein E4